MRTTKKSRFNDTMKKLLVVRTIACFMLLVLLSIDLFYVRSEPVNYVVTDILINQRKRHDEIKVVNLKTSEIRLMDVTPETIKQLQVGEKFKVYNSSILCRVVSIERTYATVSQRILPLNLFVFVLNILAIVGFIDGAINIMLNFFRSEKSAV